MNANSWVSCKQFEDVRRLARYAAEEMSSMVFSECGAAVPIDLILEAFVQDGGWPSHDRKIFADPESSANSGSSEMELFVMGERSALVEQIQRSYPTLDAILKDHCL